MESGTTKKQSEMLDKSTWQNSELEFRRLLEKLPVGAYTCDPEGLITYFNPHAVELWGRVPQLNSSVDRFCGSYRLFTVDGIPLAHDQCWMALALQNNQEYSGQEIIIERPDHRRLTVLAHAHPIHDESGKFIGAVNVLVDITARKQMEQALARNERELDDFFEKAAIGLHCVGPDGIILRANQAELDMLGYMREEYIGHPIAAFHADAQVIEDILRRLFCGESLHDYEAWLRCKDGTLKHVLISANVLWENGEFIHTRCLTRDITEQEKVEQALRASKRELCRQAELLKAADQRKDEFLATLAHELRNPLATLTNALQLLKQADHNEEIRTTALAMTERQLQYLVRLVDDLVDVSRISRGKIQLRKESLVLTTVIERTLELSSAYIEAGGHTLEVNIPAEPLILKGDLLRLAQAISNLLINAAKYTPARGHIRLSVYSEAGEVVIKVCDNGSGIPPEILPSIFEMFVQAKHPGGCAPGGLGVGLPLVKGLIELHGGRVEAATAGPEQGSTFTLWLPLGDSALMREAPSRNFSNAANILQMRRILVVDDNVDAADSTAAVLQLLGYEVVVAYEGKSALKIAQKYQPKVILLDLGMPGMDGYEVAKRLQQMPGQEGLVLIALTGWGQEADRQRTRVAGFNAHLVKPVSLEALAKILNS